MLILELLSLCNYVITYAYYRESNVLKKLPDWIQIPDTSINISSNVKNTQLYLTLFCLSHISLLSDFSQFAFLLSPLHSLSQLYISMLGLIIHTTNWLYHMVSVIHFQDFWNNWHCLHLSVKSICPSSLLYNPGYIFYFLSSVNILASMPRPVKIISLYSLPTQHFVI